jgi:hypothetical protein
MTGKLDHVRAMMDAVVNGDDNRQLAVRMHAAGGQKVSYHTDLSISIPPAAPRAPNPACNSPVPHVIESSSPMYHCITSLHTGNSHVCYGQFPV